jgi:uncharacterized membrane protein (DUF4010 family)
LIGLDREERKLGAVSYAFGGVRTYPLIGLVGYTMAYLSGEDHITLGIGFLAVSGFLMLSYWHKLVGGGRPGITSEMAGLTTYLIGALVFHQYFWVATAIGVSTMLLLELKNALEGLSQRIAPEDIFSFTKFLLLSAVILPIVPNESFGEFHINPFKTWLVVVAVSAVSYGSYVIQRITKGQGGIVVASALGGAYSSTLMTVVLAKRSRAESHPHLFSGAILVSSGMMYLRLAILLMLFNAELMHLLAPFFTSIGCLAVLLGWIWSKRGQASLQASPQESETRNPLEIKVALVFAVIFVVMLVITQLATTYLGHAGVYSLAAIMGVSDIDPFIMGMTQTDPSMTPAHVACIAILIAASSNNLIKATYAFVLSSKEVKAQSALFLILLSLFGLTPLLWL